MIKLYSYFRSSSSYRVRIALNLKNIEYETVPVHLLHEGGEQFKPEFTKLNPGHKIPVIVHEGRTIAQSVAILEYIESQFEGYSLFPRDDYNKALCRQLVEVINSDIQPLQNLSVLKKLKADHGFSDEEKVEWIKHWINIGFETFETLLVKSGGQYCMGDNISIADCYLVPQVYNANRFGVNMDRYPRISKINKTCLQREEVIAAHPDNQVDSPEGLA